MIEQIGEDDLEKAKRAQRLVNAYNRLFASEDGKKVLQDLKASFGFNQPAFIPLPSGYDATHAAIRDGQRQVILHIEAQLSAVAIGDGNLEKPKATVEIE